MPPKPPIAPWPPVAPRKPVTRTLHGRSRTDDYAWLKDENWQQVMRDPAVLRADVRAYLEAENAYTEASMAPAEALRAALFDEFRGRIKEDDSSVPAKDGAWEYYERYREGGQHPVVCRRAAGNPASEEILLDGDAEAAASAKAAGSSEAAPSSGTTASPEAVASSAGGTPRVRKDAPFPGSGTSPAGETPALPGTEAATVSEAAASPEAAPSSETAAPSCAAASSGAATSSEAGGGGYYRIGDCGHARDHRRFGWTADTNGSEFYTLRVKDLDTGRRLDDTIERCSGAFEWAADGHTLFYTLLDDNHRPCKVFRHRLGDDPAGDALVYEEPDPGFFLNVAATESRRFLVIDAHDHVTSEVRLVDASRPADAPVLVAAREPGIEYDISHHGDRLIILTNAGGAEDFKIVETPLRALAIPHQRSPLEQGRSVPRPPAEPGGAPATPHQRSPLAWSKPVTGPPATPVGAPAIPRSGIAKRPHQRSPASPDRARWTDLVPHRPGVLIVAFEVFAHWLVRLERENALPRIVVRDLESGEEHAIAFEEEAYSLGLVPGYEFETDTLRFSYSSMTTPEHVFDYDMRTRERSVRKVQEVPSGHDPAEYVTRRIMAPSHDGEAVPVSLLHRRDTPIDGSAPLLLYGYGSYGMSMPASFGTTRLSLADRGFVYAIAHVRGGTERGYAWYTNGKLAKKTNTFHDFIAAARALVEHGFTRRGRIAIHGGSAGGLLVGACANMAPELFHAVIAEVPFVDVLNTICDDTLPLTPPEWPEWGNPIESEAACERIAAYSPYDNVEAKDYPHIIATAGLTDPRVTYWEPAKWVAKLRATKTDDRLLLLHTNMEAGHGGAAGRFDRLKETALVYAFVLHVFGLE